MNNGDLKNRFSRDRAPEPQGLWEDVLAGIDVSMIRKDHSRRRTRRILYAASAFVGAAAAVVTGLFLFNDEDYDVKPVVTASNEAEQFVPEKPETDVQDGIKPVDVIDNEAVEYYAVADGEARPKEAVEHVPDEVVTDEPVTEADDESAVEGVEVSESKDDINDPVYVFDEQFPITPEKSKKKRLSIGLMANSNLKASSTSSGYDASFSKSGHYAKAAVKMNGYKINPSTNIEYKNKGKEVQTRTDYMTPIKSGLMLRWSLNHNVSLETGVQYSYLKSSTESGTEKNLSKTERTGHYMGLPFNVGYTFMNTGRLGLYTNLGAACEWRLAGESVTGYYIDNEVYGNTVHEPLKDGQFQLSANVSAGLQYRITHLMSIYAEPTMTYYINKSAFYADHPLNFSISVGLRFSL